MIKKVILSMLVLFTLVGCSSSKTEKRELKRLNERYPTYLKESVGYILSYDRTGKVLTGYSSAFVYKRNESSSYIVTSNSIVAETYTYRFVIDNKTIDCNYIGSDQYLNLAILSFDSEVYKVSALDKGLSSNLKVGNSINVSMLATYSSHLEDNMTLSKGIIGSKNSTYCVSDYLFSCNNYFAIDNVSTASGEGAPVLDYYGNVVGVVSYVPYKNNNNIISYVSPIEQVDRAMDNVLKNNKHARADLHIEVQEYKDMLPSLKAVMNIQGLKSTDLIITKVTGFSQSAGVAIRSRLVSVNGIEIKDKASLVDVLYGFKSGDSIDIVVQVTTDIYKTHTIVA